LARAQGERRRLVTVRDAETESLLRAVAHPLFRVAGVDPALVRITLIQARPINAFVTTGNRLFINTGLISSRTGRRPRRRAGARDRPHRRRPRRAAAGGDAQRHAPFAGRDAAGRRGGRGGGAAAARRRRGCSAASDGEGELYAFSRAQEQAADQAGHDLPRPARLVRQRLRRLLLRMQEQEC
jgi:predicted Zn-dependent protease